MTSLETILLAILMVIGILLVNAPKRVIAFISVYVDNTRTFKPHNLQYLMRTLTTLITVVFMTVVALFVCKKASSYVMKQNRATSYYFRSI